MKRNKSIFLLGIVACVIFSSCKKGDNDPFMSLKTRKARLCQEWELKEGFYKYNYPTSENPTSGETIWMDGNETYTYTNSNGEQMTNNSQFTKTLTFKKDYTFEMEEIQTTETSYEKNYSSGSWTFLDKSKEGDLKNKEAVHLFETYEKRTYSYSNEPEQISETKTTADNEGKIFYINRLANKELIFEVKSINKYGNSEQHTHSKEVFKRK